MTISFFKKFFEKQEARIFLLLLLRESIIISLFTIAIFLTMESILPGTVFVRSSLLFFILGLSIALIAESYISKTIPEIQNPKNVEGKKSTLKRKGTSFLFMLLFLWVTLLVGSASIGFPPTIIVLLLIFTPTLLWLFFDIIFNSIDDKQ